MAAPDPYITLALEFRYRHGFGALAPFFEALEQQRAAGTQCPRCGRCWYPPRLTCPHDFADAAWCELAPHGTVVQLTHGPGAIPLGAGSGDLAWGLVRLDGCDNGMLARLVDASGDVQRGTRVSLLGAETTPGHPIQHAVFAPGPA